MTGARIGPYEVGDEIGSGGMGIVFRATDTDLKRDVALKALPKSLASDAERLTRFRREAEMLASLNHTNIAQIYGLEQTDGTTALAMELVEGPTLAERIAQGRIAVDEALGIAMQIAAALEAAHSRGIVHRDLKPANIKLRADGTVKVLDFGIAKALEPESIRSEPSSPMLTTPATQVGVILGTAAYMSPEQAKGQAVDQRTDIWAFGCVLYEMLSGQLAFGAEDVATTLARVIANEPNTDALPARTPPAVRRTIELCLQKDTKHRIFAIADVMLALQGAFETIQASDPEVMAKGSAWRYAVTATAAAVITAIAATVFVLTRPQPARPVNRFEYVLPNDHTLALMQLAVFALAPDGRSFAYNTTGGVYIRTMENLEPRLLVGTEREDNLGEPFFSPDGSALGFFAAGQLKRLSIVGGQPVTISRQRGRPDGAFWAVDDMIYFGQPEGMYRVPASGGMRELVVAARDGEEVYGPQLLPDGDSLLFSVRAGISGAGRIVVERLSTGERSVVVEAGSDAHFVSSGHIVYALEDALYARRFDVDTLTTFGGATPIVQGVLRATDNPAANYGIGSDGTLAYLSGNVTLGSHSLVWVDRQGTERALDIEPQNYVSPRISPDGLRLAIDSRDREFDIWTFDFARRTLTRVTEDPGADEFPAWSPDGRRIAFSSTRGGGAQGDTSVYWRAADATGEATLLADGDGQTFPTAFLPDGSGILVYGTPSDPSRADDDDNISIVRIDDHSITPVLESTNGEATPEIAPNGAWFAYMSDESGRPEIYLRPYPDIETRRLPVSTNGGVEPLWSRDGSELYYRGDGALMAVSVTWGEDGPELGPPQRLFDDHYVRGPGGRTYDTFDGERFLMIRQSEAASTSARIVIVQNWVQELERLLPATD